MKSKTKFQSIRKRTSKGHHQQSHKPLKINFFFFCCRCEGGKKEKGEKEREEMVKASRLGGIRGKKKKKKKKKNLQKGECRDQDGCSNVEVPICLF